MTVVSERVSPLSSETTTEMGYDPAAEALNEMVGPFAFASKEGELGKDQVHLSLCFFAAVESKGVTGAKVILPAVGTSSGSW